MRTKRSGEANNLTLKQQTANKEKQQARNEEQIMKTRNTNKERTGEGHFSNKSKLKGIQQMKFKQGDKCK
jgi:hypothetical protein